MENLNKESHYKRDVVLLESGNFGNWLLASGFSNEKKVDCFLTTNHLHVDEVPEELTDAYSTLELVVKLLNHYYKGELFVGDPNQLTLPLSETNHLHVHLNETEDDN